MTRIFTDETLGKATGNIIREKDKVEILEIKGNRARVRHRIYIKDTVGTSPAFKIADASYWEVNEGWVDLANLRYNLLENKECRMDTYFEFQDNYPIECTYVGTTSTKLKKSPNEDDKTLIEQKIIKPNEKLKVIERTEDRKYLKVKYGDGVDDNGWIESIHLKIKDDYNNLHTCRTVPPPSPPSTPTAKGRRIISSSGQPEPEPKHVESEPKPKP